MLEQRIGPGRIVYYASARLEALGVRHAFSTRLGGISPAPFDSLNLGNPNGCDVRDDYDRIWANYGRLLRAIDCPVDPPLRVHQAHGCGVVEVDANTTFDTGIKADAIVSRDAYRPISVRTADCLPVLVASKDGRMVAAIHAGWRGVIAGVIPTAIARLLSLHSHITASDLVAAVGPGIGPGAFEVGDEVLTAFRKCFAARAPIALAAGGKGTVDLSAAARLQLLDLGLPADQIDFTDRCTVTHAGEFFSHRRERGITGRMAAVIIPNVP